MAIVVRKLVIRPSPYRDERELEESLATHPELLLEGEEPALALDLSEVGLSA